MGLFDRSRRKRDEPEREETETETEPEDFGEEESLSEAANWYRAMYSDALPAGDDVLLHYPERRTAVLLPGFEFDLLAHCTHFAPVEAHAADAASRTGLPADGVVQNLYELVDRGLLVSQQEVVEGARAAAEAAKDLTLPLDRVSVITNDRPANLAACLRSYRERYGAELELVVFDDAADAATRAANRRVVADAAGEGRILYAGHDEKERFVDKLSQRSGVDADIVRSALTDFDGITFHCGANRNAVLLDAAGGTALMIDDDTTVRAATTAGPAQALCLSSSYDPWSVRFFAGVDDALDAADWQDADLLAWHRRFLGRSPAACALRSGADDVALLLNPANLMLNLNEADASLITAFSNGRGRVIATASGVAGDSGVGLPLYFLSLQGAQRERLLENYESYHATRGVHRGADEATISNTELFMGAHVALDVRATIPPFPPVLRNSDGVFGALLRNCSPESYIAFLPWLVEHAPPDARPADFDDVVRSVASVRANDIISNLARDYDPAPGVTDATIRLRAFGHYLTALGAIPPDDFNSLVRHQITATVGRRIEQLTRAVNYHGGEPARWAEDCASVISEGQRALTEDDLIVADVPGATPDERHQRFQRLIHGFGRVIDAWPALLRAAVGLRVAAPLTS